jgi:hypothetical protein
VSGQLVFPFGHAPLGRISRGRAPRSASRGPSRGDLAPRISPAAVRVPDPRYTSLALQFPAGHPQIFVHEGARQALERRLSMANGSPVILSVTDNVRQMVSHTLATGVLQIRLHHMFLDAPVFVQEALVRYVVAADRSASQVVGKYIEDNGFRIRASRPISRPLLTVGASHDLLTIFNQVNAKYFAGAVDALITWAQSGRPLPAGLPRTPRRTIKLGSYSATERLIRVHPALDRPWVPRYFVSYIVYHEMLHHVIPSSQGSGRRMLHPPIFMARERLFRDFDRAMAWERAHISRLLRS